jgi:DnaJ-class molecular chaperone
VNYTHYDFLEVPPSAPAERIDAAYARLLKRLQHGQDEERGDMSSLLLRIHVAYDVVHNEASRKSYDELLAREAALADDELKLDLDRKSIPPARHVQEVPYILNAAFTALAA